MLDFEYEQPETRVVVGHSAVSSLPDEVRRLDCERAIVIATPSQGDEAAEAAETLGTLGVAVFVEPAPHIPIDVVQRAEEKARLSRADIAVVIGGGNAIGVGKVVGVRLEIPVIAVPTTYSGSEATPNYGWTESEAKKVFRDRRALPRTVLYDPNLAVSLPPGISATSGMNAMAHLVMGMYAADSNPIGTLFGREGTRSLAHALPAIVADPANLEARAEAFHGAWLAGSMLRMGTSAGVHYTLCHVLGGTFRLGHAEVHTVLLPHSTALLRGTDPEATNALSEALGGGDPADTLYDLAGRLECPRSLAEIGMPEERLSEVVTRVLDRDHPGPHTLPRNIPAQLLTDLLRNAFVGNRPG